MNTIDDMQNEMDFYDYYNEFEYDLEYIKLVKYSFIYISMYIKYNYFFKKLMKYSYIYISMYTKYKYTYMCESIYSY